MKGKIKELIEIYERRLEQNQKRSYGHDGISAMYAKGQDDAFGVFIYELEKLLGQENGEKPKEKAMSLFGEMRNINENEKRSYSNMLNLMSEPSEEPIGYDESGKK